MKEKNSLLKIFAVIIIIISISTSFIGISNTQYYIDGVKQALKTSSPNVTNEQMSITIKYIDTQGNALLPEEIIKGKIGEWYKTDRIDIPCYRAYGDEPINKNGYFQEDSKDIIYVYKPSNESYSIEQQNNNVTIVYGDMKIPDVYELTVESTNLYNEKINNIKYELQNEEQSSLSSGVTENGDLYLGTLTVREEGKKKYIIKQIDVPNEYKKIIDNDISFTLNQTWDKASKKFIVNIEYDTNLSGLKIDVENKKIKVKIQYKDAKYDVSIKQFVSEVDGIKKVNNEIKTSLDKNGKIIYTKNENMEKVENNQELIFTIRIYNESENAATIKDIFNEIPQGLEYINNELNNQNGWKLYKINSSGDLEETTNISEAEYIKTSILDNTELKGFNKQTMLSPEYKELKIALKVKENKLNNGRIATNKVKLQDDSCDANKENNTDECSVYVKKFDLNIEKNIINVTVENNEGQKIINKKSNEEILKIDIPKKEIENTKLKIKYEIKVTNIGEINGYATEITDYLPEGFEAISTQTTQWVVNGNEVKTNSLNKNLLQPGESKSIFIECTYKVNKENIGSKINSVKITEYENDSDSKDITEDNEDKEEIIITIKTGFTAICFTTIIVALLISIAVIIILKRKNK
nr:MucBP domain-containing protein [Clostridia bacterium]